MSIRSFFGFKSKTYSQEVLMEYNHVLVQRLIRILEQYNLENMTSVDKLQILKDIKDQIGKSTTLANVSLNKEYVPIQAVYNLVYTNINGRSYYDLLLDAVTHAKVSYLDILKKEKEIIIELEKFSAFKENNVIELLRKNNDTQSLELLGRLQKIKQNGLGKILKIAALVIIFANIQGIVNAQPTPILQQQTTQVEIKTEYNKALEEYNKKMSVYNIEKEKYENKKIEYESQLKKYQLITQKYSHAKDEIKKWKILCDEENKIGKELNRLREFGYSYKDTKYVNLQKKYDEKSDGAYGYFQSLRNKGSILHIGYNRDLDPDLIDANGNYFKTCKLTSSFRNRYNNHSDDGAFQRILKEYGTYPKELQFELDNGEAGAIYSFVFEAPIKPIEPIKPVEPTKPKILVMEEIPNPYNGMYYHPLSLAASNPKSPMGYFSNSMLSDDYNFNKRGNIVLTREDFIKLPKYIQNKYLGERGAKAWIEIIQRDKNRY